MGAAHAATTLHTDQAGEVGRGELSSDKISLSVEPRAAAPLAPQQAAQAACIKRTILFELMPLLERWPFHLQQQPVGTAARPSEAHLEHAVNHVAAAHDVLLQGAAGAGGRQEGKKAAPAPAGVITHGGGARP